MGFISELIGIPLGYIMWAIYSLCKNYGLSIIIFTVIIRLVLVPISVKQQKSTAAMAAFQPKLDKLKKQYANNPNKLQEEQMKLYAEENINPMASCLPLFFQLFFLYGVFDVVYRPLTHILHISKDAVESLKTVASSLYETSVRNFSIRPEMYILQAVKDNPEAFAGKEGISAELIDQISGFNNKLFGLVDVGSIPNSVFEDGHVWTAASVALLMIPIITGILQIVTVAYSNFRQKKMNPDTAAQMGGMNIMMYGMSAMFIWITFSTPAGIGFYWICSSLVGLLQTIILNRIFTPEYVAKLVEKDRIKNKNKKRSGFMEKYQEALQEQLRQQNGGSAPDNSRRRLDDGEEIKMSRSQMNEYQRQIIAEARRRQIEKYGDPNANKKNDD